MFKWKYFFWQNVSYSLSGYPLASVSALRSRVSALEEELCAKAVTIKSIQNEMVQSKKEISAKELNIQRARDELSLAHARIAKESERVRTHYWKCYSFCYFAYLHHHKGFEMRLSRCSWNVDF